MAAKQGFLKYYTKGDAIGTKVSVRYRESGRLSGVVVKRGSTVLHLSLCLQQIIIIIIIAWTLPLITRYRNTLRRRGLHRRIAYVACFRVVPLMQFRIFARKSPFSRSGSNIIKRKISR